MNIGVFFSYRVGLATWDKLGILSRETRYFEALRERGHAVSFWTWDSPEHLDRYREKFPSIPIRSWRESAPARRMPAWLLSLCGPWLMRRELASVEVIRTNQMMGAWQAALAKIVLGKRLLLRVGYDLYSFHRHKKSGWAKSIAVYGVSRMVYRMADQILTTTEEAREAIQTHFRPHATVSVCSNYVDTDLFKPGSSHEVGSAMIYVGRLDHHKGVEDAIRMSILANLPLTVVGEGPLRGELERRVAAAGARVQFLGKVPNEKLPGILATHRYFVFLSHSEGNPKALLEALSTGLIPIGRDAPGIREIVAQVSPGTLLSDTSDESLKRMAKHLTDPALNDVAIRARRYALERCSLAAAIDLETKLLERMRA